MPSLTPWANVSRHSTATKSHAPPAARSANIVLLGAASPYLDIDADTLRDCIRQRFGSKGEAAVEANIKAFDAGSKISLQ